MVVRGSDETNAVVKCLLLFCKELTELLIADRLNSADILKTKTNIPAGNIISKYKGLNLTKKHIHVQKKNHHPLEEDNRLQVYPVEDKRKPGKLFYFILFYYFFKFFFETQW